jgi:hypothetical protein
MARISQLAIQRALFVGLWLLSAVPWVCYRAVSLSRSYDLRIFGLHPSEILVLRSVSAWAVYPPFIIFAGGVLATVRPAWTSAVLTICTTVFLLYVLLFLLQLAMAFEFDCAGIAIDLTRRWS